MSSGRRWTTRVIIDNTQAIEQVRVQALDLDDRLKASIASEREALARSSQQATSFASTEARYQQQLASLKAHDVRIRETLRSLRWPEANIHTLMSPSSALSSSAAPGSNASTSSSHRPTSLSPSLVKAYTPSRATQRYQQHAPLATRSRW